MKDQKSQQGSDMPVKSREEVKRKKGHMALRNNVWTIRNLLWRELSALEMCCLDLVTDRTIGWRQAEAKIKVEDFVEFSGKRKDEVYRALRSLRSRQIIRQRKCEHVLYFSLNDEYFGGLLIKRHEEALQKRKSVLRKVVDNSTNDVNSKTENSSEVNGNSVQLERNYSPVKTEIPSESDTQGIENIKENGSLNTLLKDIYIKTSLKSVEIPKTARELHSFSRGRKPQRSVEEHERIVKEQLAQLRAAQGETA